MVNDVLEGIRVLDFTRFVSGSYATMLLGALGADVIKIEAMPDGDPYRAQGTARVGDTSALFLSLNNGKRSLAVDLADEDGRQIVERLLASCDVFVENSRPGGLARIGLDFDSVHARHPKVVYGSISGYGQVGPMSHLGGFDLILQAEAGVMSVTGSPESGPVKVGLPMLDIGAGLAVTCGIVAALFKRERTRSGSHVSSSLFEVALAGLTTLAADYFVTGETPGLLGADSPTFAPSGAFRARDGYLVFAGAGAEHLWASLCDVLDLPDLRDDPRFMTNADRVRNRSELTAYLEKRLASQDAATWVQTLAAAGIPAGTVQDLGQVVASSQTAALGMVQSLRTGDGIAYDSVGSPIRLDCLTHYRCGAPALGEHTRDVLLEVGLTEPDISDLLRRGVVRGAC